MRSESMDKLQAARITHAVNKSLLNGKWVTPAEKLAATKGKKIVGGGHRSNIWTIGDKAVKNPRNGHITNAPYPHIGTKNYPGNARPWGTGQRDPKNKAEYKQRLRDMDAERAAPKVKAPSKTAGADRKALAVTAGAGAAAGGGAALYHHENKTPVKKAWSDEDKRKARKGAGVAAVGVGSGVAAGGAYKIGETYQKLTTPRSYGKHAFPRLKGGAKGVLGGSALAGGGLYVAHRNKKDTVHKELSVKNPIEIEKADALWRRDEDIEKGVFGGLAQGLKRTQSMGPMTRGTQAGFNAGSGIRNAGSKIAGAARSFGRGAKTPVGPMAANAPAAAKAGQAVGRAPGRLVSAVQAKPKTAIGIGAGAGAAAGGAGVYGATRPKKKY